MNLLIFLILAPLHIMAQCTQTEPGLKNLASPPLPLGDEIASVLSSGEQKVNAIVADAQAVNRQIVDLAQISSSIKFSVIC